jgi:hypothetical protein
MSSRCRAPLCVTLNARCAVDEDELKAAFEFFDVQGKGVLTPADLKQRCEPAQLSPLAPQSVPSSPKGLGSRLGVFYKNLPAREYKFLVSEPDFTYKTLHRLLANNELKVPGTHCQAHLLPWTA